MSAALSAEDRLLLECARSELDGEARTRVAELVRGGLDWSYVVEAAVRHAVAPLLKRSLDQVCGAEVPRAVEDELDALYRMSARRNERLFRALGEVVAAFAEAGVEVVALKDAALAVDVYPERALRPMGDIDLLIHREDYERAAGALAALGFAPRPHSDVPYTLAYATGQHFRRGSDELWIDLQWNVGQREWDLRGEGRFTYRIAELWESAQPLRIDGYELLAPTTEQMLFHLCVHLEGHEYAELVLFSDIVELLRHGGDVLDWGELVALARSHDAASSVYYALLVTERLFGAAVPDAVLSELEPPYFYGSVFGPIFGNLTSLHLALDEIRLAASPPRRVLDELERVVRRQAARAMRLDAELDALTTEFLDGGGTLAVLDGDPSPRRFPDPAVAAFGELRAFVLDDDSARFDAALDRCGFTVTGKECVIASGDPVLAGESLSLTITVEVSTDVADALAREQPVDTNAGAALRSLRAGRARRSDREAVCRLVVFELPAEELVVCLAARLAARAEGRLFGLCALLDLFGRLRRAASWERVAELARRHGVEPEVAAGLALASAVLDLGAALPVASVSPRLLEWARYGPASVLRRTGLRRGYLYFLALRSLGGARAKARYVVRSFVRPPYLLHIFRELMVGILQPRERSVREFAYWVERTP